MCCLVHSWEDVICQPSERSVQHLITQRQSYWWSKEDTGDLEMKSTEPWGFLWQGTRAAHPTEATKESGGSHGSAFASLEKVCKEATLMKLGRQHQWLNASFLYHKNCLEVSRPAKIYTIICYCVNENQATKSLHKSCVRFEGGGGGLCFLEKK